MVSTRARGERTDEEYAAVERFASETHEQVGEVWEWPKGWLYACPEMMSVIDYRTWLREKKSREVRGDSPQSFVEWMRAIGSSARADATERPMVAASRMRALPASRGLAHATGVVSCRIVCDESDADRSGSSSSSRVTSPSMCARVRYARMRASR